AATPATFTLSLHDALPISQPLVPAELRFAAPGRMGPDGVQRLMDERAARALVEEVARREPRAIAVALLHSYAHPAHERALGELRSEEHTSELQSRGHLVCR